MANLIALLILLISFLGIVAIVFRKIPILASLPIPKTKEKSILEKSIAKIKSNGFLKSFSPDMVLHKTLSKIRVITLKTESKTADWLKDLRQKSLEKKKSFSDDYWKKIKK